MSHPKISSAAIKHFAKTIKNNNVHGILFQVKKAGCSGLKYDMSFIDAMPDNAERLLYDHVNLYVQQSSLAYLSKTTIDLEHASLGQTKVVFFNPLAQNACGCGESFNINEVKDE